MTKMMRIYSILETMTFENKTKNNSVFTNPPILHALNKKSKVIETSMIFNNFMTPPETNTNRKIKIRSPPNFLY